jgi:hypothetical protein
MDGRFISPVYEIAPQSLRHVRFGRRNAQREQRPANTFAPNRLKIPPAQNKVLAD